MFKKRDKRGLSEVVVTLIIILLVLVAIGIVWVVVRNIIQSGAEDIGSGKFLFNMEINSASINGNNLIVNVFRKPGVGSLEGIKFALEGIGGLKNIDNTSAEAKLDELESGSFTIDYAELGLTSVEKVSIYPIFEKGKYGNLADTYEIAYELALTCGGLDFNCDGVTNNSDVRLLIDNSTQIDNFLLEFNQTFIDGITCAKYKAFLQKAYDAGNTDLSNEVSSVSNKMIECLSCSSLGQGIQIVNSQNVFCDSANNMWSTTFPNPLGYKWQTTITYINEDCTGLGSNYPACNACDNLDYAGFTNWRLPRCIDGSMNSNTCEIWRFFNDACDGGTGDCSEANSWDTDNRALGNYWSSTTASISDDQAYRLGDIPTSPDISDELKSWVMNVRCVR